MPEISVIMPVYNTNETYLRESIESILKQTFKDFEFIIINDGSSVNIEKVIKSFDDKRIKYYENEDNKGIVYTLNRGFELASGKYIARMDSDDISLPNRFKQQVDFMNRNLDVAVLGTWMETFPDKKIIRYPVKNETIEVVLSCLYCALAHPTIFLRKKIVNDFNLRYDEANVLAEDLGLWLSLIDKIKFANIPEVLLKYRVHEEQVSQSYSEIQTSTVNRLRYQSQEKNILGINNKQLFAIFLKIKDKTTLTRSELDFLLNYSSLLLNQVKGEAKNIEMGTILTPVKKAIGLCPKNLKFFKCLLNKNFYKIALFMIIYKLKKML